MATALLAPAVGLVVGGVLALTGAGGAILAVPLLVFGLGLPLAQAAPISLLTVALAGGLGAFLAWRRRVLRYRAAAVMALAGLLAAPVGQWLAQRLPERPLLLVFAAVLALAAARTLHQARLELRGGLSTRRTGVLCRRNPATGRLHWTSPCALALAATGAGAGFLSGLLGVGGGFVLVPTLLLLTDLAMESVVATSMGVIALVSSGAAAWAAVQGLVLWWAALPFGAGAVTGLLLGRAWAGHIAGPRLQQGFGGVSLLVAAGMALRALA